MVNVQEYILELYNIDILGTDIKVQFNIIMYTDTMKLIYFIYVYKTIYLQKV